MDTPNKNPQAQANTCESQGQQQSRLSHEINAREEDLQRYKRLQELEIAARPLQAYLAKYHNPHVQIGVSFDRVTVAEELCSTPL